MGHGIFIPFSPFPSVHVGKNARARGEDYSRTELRGSAVKITFGGPGGGAGSPTLLGGGAVLASPPLAMFKLIPNLEIKVTKQRD